jgi:hypothetical protein
VFKLLKFVGELQKDCLVQGNFNNPKKNKSQVLVGQMKNHSEIFYIAIQQS